jgi:hypothetical protein
MFFIKKTFPEIEKPDRKEFKIRNLDFFPIGIYDASSADFRELKNIGFNAIHVSYKDLNMLSGILRSASKNKLKVITRFPEKVQGSDAEILLPSEALLGWYLDDEPEGRGVSPKILREHRDLILERGFFQPAAIALNRPWRAVDYAAAVDVVMCDQYPIPFNPLSWLSASLDEVHEIFGPGSNKRVWAVIQSFGWNIGSRFVRESGEGREPTREELLALSYLAVVHRVKGLFYYTYRAGRYCIKDKKELWEGLKKTVKEISGIYPLILSPEVNDIVRMECEINDEWDIPAVHFIGKQYDPESLKKESLDLSKGPGFSKGVYLIAVNSVNRPVSVKFMVTGGFEKQISVAEDIFSGERFSFVDSTLDLSFDAYKRRILKLIR